MLNMDSIIKKKGLDFSLMENFEHDHFEKLRKLRNQTFAPHIAVKNALQEMVNNPNDSFEKLKFLEASVANSRLSLEEEKSIRVSIQNMKNC